MTPPLCEEFTHRAQMSLPQFSQRDTADRLGPLRVEAENGTPQDWHAAGARPNSRDRKLMANAARRGKMP